MKGGDIDNVAPSIIMVNVECVISREYKRGRLLRIGPVLTSIKKNLDLLSARRLFEASLDITASVELFSVDDPETLTSITDQLDRLGLDFHRWSHNYDSVSDVLHELPLRNVAGVVDLEDKALRWGSYFLPFEKVVK